MVKNNCCKKQLHPMHNTAGFIMICCLFIVFCVSTMENNRDNHNSAQEFNLCWNRNQLVVEEYCFTKNGNDLPVIYSMLTFKKIDINKAIIRELETVPGIGNITAQKIINNRNLHGEYGDLDELLLIDGIGRKKIKKYSAYLTVGKSE